MKNEIKLPCALSEYMQKIKISSEQLATTLGIPSSTVRNYRSRGYCVGILNGETAIYHPDRVVAWGGE